MMSRVIETDLNLYNLFQHIGWISRVKDVSKTIEEQEEGL